MSPEKERVTVMILYVDLKCSCCYKKVRKLLSKFPQIRGQVFDEEKNKVMITVVCCNPEGIRDKLCCKGGNAIQSIEILEPPPPSPPKPKPKPRPPTPKPTEPDPPKKPDPVPMLPFIMQPPPPMPEPRPQPQPFSACCQCYECRGGGLCHDYGYYGGYRSAPPRYVRSDYEDPHGCSVM